MPELVIPSTNTIPKNIAETIIAELPQMGLVQDISVPDLESVTMTEPYIIAVPKGLAVHDLTSAWQAAKQTLQPYRRKGTAKLQDLQSLILWANRFKGETSMLYANIGAKPSLICIADYHGAGEPVIDATERDCNASHCHHRAVYDFPVSGEWKIWNDVDGKGLPKEVFGEFIEVNSKDLLNPSPALLSPNFNDPTEDWEVRMVAIAEQLGGRFGQYQTLVQLSKSFKVNESSFLTTSFNRDTGEQQLQFLDEHRDPDGAPIRIPNLFLIAIPIFENGPLYRIAVRFRYVKAGADVKFRMDLYNPDQAFRAVVDEALAEAVQKTALPCLRGTPEA